MLVAGIAITEPCALILEREWGTEENSRRPRGEVALGEALVGGGAIEQALFCGCSIFGLGSA